MGLYYQAILSSLLLNFLPDLPTTSFFTPQSPILFFSLWLLLFSLCFFHITADFQQVQKFDFFAFVRAIYFFILFFFHTKSPHFLWGLSSRTDRSLPQSQRWWPRHRALKEKLPKSGNLNLYCGSSDSCFQLTMAHGMPTPHWPPTIQTHGASTLSPKITTNTLIHSLTFHLSLCHSLCPPWVFFVAC